jgi:hypothetical protein
MIIAAKTGLTVSAGLLLIIASALMPGASPLPEAFSRTKDMKAAAQRNSSAFAVILGEFRTNLSDLIFIKTERYLDSGVAYMPHIDESQLEGKTEDDHDHDHDAHDHDSKHDHDHDAHAHDSKHDHDHDSKAPGHEPEHEDALSSDTITSATAETTASFSDSEARFDQHLATPEMAESATIKPGTVKVESASSGHEHHDHAGHDHAAHEETGEDAHEHHDDHSMVPTIIRTADKDFRGFIGDLERQIKPWRNPSEGHKHTPGTELLPWYRLGTYSDPQNVRMYMIGSWWLKTLRTPEQIQEALRFLDEGIANNPDAFQLFLMRGYILRQLKRPQEAEVSFASAATLGLKQRPADESTTGPLWSLTMEEHLEGAVTMHVLSVRDREGTSTAVDLARSYAKHFKNPANSTKRLIQTMGAIP